MREETYHGPAFTPEELPKSDPYRTPQPPPARPSLSVEVDVSITTIKNDLTGESFFEVEAFRAHPAFNICWSSRVTFPAALLRLDAEALLNAIVDVLERVA